MIRVTGAREVARAMERLGDRLVAAQEDALRHAAEPIITDAKGRAPSTTIADGIQVVQVVERDGGIVAEVGLPGGRRDWFYGLFYELGTGPRVQKTTGRLTGSMPANPFLRPAFDAQAGVAQRRYFDVMKRHIEAAGE
jgi:HK97 gp10 family phage protein